MRVLFRTDAGAAIGLGHLQRCLSLAEAFRRRGADCFFTIYGDLDAVERARHAGFAAEAVDAMPASSSDVDIVAEAAARWRCSVVVVDSYLINERFLRELRDGGAFVVAIDDRNAFPFACQMVVAFGPQALTERYETWSGDTRWLLGPRYAILRPEFWDVPLPPIREGVRNVLVSTGGADPDGVMPSWIAGLDAVNASFDVTAIIGPFFGNADDVHDAARSCERTVRVISSPAVMRPIMAAADIALSAAGQTLYELCALGIPTVAVEIAPNQRPQLSAFAAAGTVIDAGSTITADGKRIAAEAGKLIADPEARMAMSEAARAAVDRRGALAVADAIITAAEA